MMSRYEYERAVGGLSKAVADQMRYTLKLREALDSIAHYVTEGWNADSDADWSALADILRDAGYDIGWPDGAEPEPFIHGDNAEGPAGGRARCETEGFAEGAEG